MTTTSTPNIGLWKQVDQYLLINHRLLWATKIHYVLFYGLLLWGGMFILLGSPLLSPDQLPAPEVAGWMAFFVAIVPMGSWLYKQSGSNSGQLSLLEEQFRLPIYLLAFSIFLLLSPATITLIKWRMNLPFMVYYSTIIEVPGGLMMLSMCIFCLANLLMIYKQVGWNTFFLSVGAFLSVVVLYFILVTVATSLNLQEGILPWLALAVAVGIIVGAVAIYRLSAQAEYRIMVLAIATFITPFVIWIAIISMIPGMDIVYGDVNVTVNSMLGALAVYYVFCLPVYNKLFLRLRALPRAEGS